MDAKACGQAETGEVCAQDFQCGRSPLDKLHTGRAATECFDPNRPGAGIQIKECGTFDAWS
jgi:hypothetical protein